MQTQKNPSPLLSAANIKLPVASSECRINFYTDIDECIEQTDSCEGIATCSNADGSYTCSCPDGFALDGFSCAGDFDSQGRNIKLFLSIANSNFHLSSILTSELSKLSNVNASLIGLHTSHQHDISKAMTDCRIF